MRRSRELINKARKNGRRRGLRSAEAQRNKRLSSALEAYRPRDYLVYEIATFNAREGHTNYLEIWHEAYGGNNRYAVYLNGEKWRNGWSRTRFCQFLFEQIDSVIRMQN